MWVKKNCIRGHKLAGDNLYFTQRGKWRIRNCKKCNIERGKAYYARNIDLRRKQSRIFWKKHTKNPEIARKAVEKWDKANPEKKKAHELVRLAIKAKKLIRKPCEVCGKRKTHGHHQDYTKPLQVLWLCPIHHKEQHRKEKLLALTPF